MKVIHFPLSIVLFVCCLWACDLKEIPDEIMPIKNQLTADFDFTLSPSNFAPCTATFTEKAANETAYAWFINGTPRSSNATSAAACGTAANMRSASSSLAREPSSPATRCPGLISVNVSSISGGIRRA